MTAKEPAPPSVSIPILEIELAIRRQIALESQLHSTRYVLCDNIERALASEAGGARPEATRALRFHPAPGIVIV